MILIFYFFRTQGWKYIITITVLFGSRELVRILFKTIQSKLHHSVFCIFLISIYGLSSWKPEFSGLIFSFFSIGFCLFTFIKQYEFKDPQELFKLQAKSVLGFFYMGLLPSFAFQLLSLPQGFYWFTSMLCVVFAGDIMAYAVGLNWGRNKLMPLVSPKKTIEGSLGGLAGSVIVGLLCGHFLLNASSIEAGLLSLATGVVAQFGDLFESLLKRVADVKDSGRIMPGHGGILDRIDGLLFASPIFLFGAIILEKMH